MSVADTEIFLLTTNLQTLSGLGQHCVHFASTTVTGQPEIYREPSSVMYIYLVLLQSLQGRLSGYLAYPIKYNDQEFGVP